MPADERYGDWFDPQASPSIEMNRMKPHPSAGVNTNALRLVQQNPRLHTLTIEHGRQTYGVDHFTPQVLHSILMHSSLTSLDIQLNFVIKVDFLEVILRHLPQQLEQLYVCVEEFALVLGDDNTDHHYQPAHSTATTTTATVVETPGCLRKICFRTSSSGRGSSWMEDCLRTSREYYFHTPSYPERLVLPLLRRSPRLQELVLGGYPGHDHRLVQTLFQSCPDLEVLDIEGRNSYDEDVPLVGGILSKLRTLRLRSDTYLWSFQNQNTFSEVLAVSASTLEVLWLEGPRTEIGRGYLNPLCMRGADKDGGNRLVFPRLKELVMWTRGDWDYPDTVSEQHNYDHHSESGDSHGVYGFGLGSNQPLSAIFPSLERLSLEVRDGSPRDCSDCSCSLGGGRKDNPQREFLQRRRLERQETHRRQFASRFRQLISGSRSCEGLTKFEMHWQLCDTIRNMTQEDLLECVNGDRQTCSAIEGSAQEGSVVAPITAEEDLEWMDLLSLPTRAQVAKKKASKAKKHQRKEWEKEVLETLEQNLSITRYADPLDPLYQRVGRGWQDWESLAGRCGCEFELAMTKRKPGTCSGSNGGGGRWRRGYEEHESREWMGCPHFAGGGFELEDHVLV